MYRVLEQAGPGFIWSGSFVGFYTFNNVSNKVFTYCLKGDTRTENFRADFSLS